MAVTVVIIGIAIANLSSLFVFPPFTTEVPPSEVEIDEAVTFNFSDNLNLNLVSYEEAQDSYGGV